MDALPLIDLRGAEAAVAAEIDRACRTFGFYRITGHGVAASRQASLDELAREFFAQPEAAKAAIAMEQGGAAWRGWFPLDGELTSGVPDHKEGIYFGTELAADHPAVRAGRPLHGPNQFPARPAGLRAAVLGWLDEMAAL